MCKNDKGATQHRFSHHWTTFLKARLNCSLPGEFPFYFDEIRKFSKLFCKALIALKSGYNEWFQELFMTLPNFLLFLFLLFFFFKESTSDIVEGTYGHRNERLIYGVFTTPENSIYGSAVCAFRMQDVLDSFDGPFRVGYPSIHKKRNFLMQLFTNGFECFFFF